MSVGCVCCKQRIAKTRGNCHICLRDNQAKIARKETTEEQLIREGKMLAKKISPWHRYTSERS